MLKNKQGITLVELLIVIVIMGIIAAIAIPAVGNIVENTQKDAVLTDAQTIANQARTACLTETWQACDIDWDDYDSTDEGWAGDGDGVLFLSSTELGDYIEGIDGEYQAWRHGGTWYVAILTDDWAFVGVPGDSERGDVVEADDKEIGDIDEDQMSVGDPEWPTTAE